MSELAIEVLGIAKRYRVGAVVNYYPTIREAIVAGTRRVIARTRGRLGGTQGAAANFAWALDDVSFTVPPGEAVGIIGRNGAGKTTLLKILTRVTRPTRGRARLRGRVGSLLEVGAGFHPELTGRENIFLNGAILGMSRADIRARFEAIVEFAGVGRYLDTSFKHYSSGMGLRLAFSIAAHLEPEILLVDEVLAVGDREFQRKCMGKIGDAAHQGRTVLFVSHDLAAVQTLTTRALLLDQGRCIADGPTTVVMGEYLQSLAPPGQAFRRDHGPAAPHIAAVSLDTSEPHHRHRHGQPFGIHIELHSPAALERPSLSVQVLSELQQPVLEIPCSTAELSMATAGDYELACRLPALNLNAGRYTVRVELHSPASHAPVDRVDGVCPFEVALIGFTHGWPLRSKAISVEPASWTITRQ